MKRRRNILTIATGIVLVVVFLLFMITYVVREGEVGVLTTFGKVVGVVDQPGLYWKAPWPIQSVVTLDARLHTDKGRFEETKTSDGELIMVRAYYNWRVADPKTFYEKLYRRSKEETLREVRLRLGAIVRDAKNDVFGHYPFSDLLPRIQSGSTPGPAGGGEEAGGAAGGVAVTKFGDVEHEILSMVKDQASHDYGIEVAQVGIMRFELPEATTTAVFNRMRAEREGYAAQIRAAGKGEAEGIRARADYEGDIILAEAEAQAERYKAQGDVEAARYNVIFAKNPELHYLVRGVEALKAVINERSVLVLSTDSVLFKLLQELPPKLLGMPGKAPEDQE